MSRHWLPSGDVSELPDYAFGATTMGYWGVVGFMLIEGMGFILALGVYFYLLPNEPRWPPTTPPPPLLWGTLVTAMLVLSDALNVWLNRRAHAQDARAVRVGLLLMTLLGVLVLVLRGFEMDAMNVRWDHTAYGSIVWALLALHTFHAITDVYDSAVLAALLHARPIDGRKFSDVADNALYWHFIVWSWVVLYFVIYWTPRWT
jgi:heme/copper-type cytochrome/quinol oxidase subunit 3